MPSLQQITRMLRQSKPRYLTASKDKTESLIQKIGLAILVAALSFLGASAGTVVSSRYETAKWERETNYTARQTLLNKRIDLLDRTVRIFNKRDAAKVLALVVKSTAEINAARIRQAISKKQEIDDSKAVDRIVASRLQFDDLTAEFGALMTLDALYYGPKTRDAIKNMTENGMIQQWWELDDKFTNAVGAAMYQELNP